MAFSTAPITGTAQRQAGGSPFRTGSPARSASPQKKTRNPGHPKQSGSLTRDTLLLTANSLIIQGMSLLLNVLITRRLGPEAMGISTLIFSFYGFVIILANGNVFTSTSRFVSEEIGKGCGDADKILSYSLTFGVTLSSLAAAALCIFSQPLGMKFLHSPDSVWAIRLLGLSLPLATVGSCLKGYFHARRSVKKPCISDILESTVKLAVLYSFVQWLIPEGRSNVFTAISVSIIAGEIVSCFYLSLSYARSRNPALAHCPEGRRATIPCFGKYLLAILPIVVSGYTFVLLSGANEALVPLTLLQYSGSSGVALAQYGVFEGIVMQVIFFPSILLQSLSTILVPEFARLNMSGEESRLKFIAAKVIRQGLCWSIFVGLFLLFQGENLGALTCDDPLAGWTLKLLCPIVPFIYLEMLLEGILKGMGRQNFCTLNSAVEYVIRISCVLVFVPLTGFPGILISYFASNITCNIVRIVAVVKAAGLRFDWANFLWKPLSAAAAAGTGGALAVHFFSLSGPGSGLNVLAQMALFTIPAGGIYLLALWLFRRMGKKSSCQAEKALAK